jgi:hypothetical protein
LRGRSRRGRSGCRGSGAIADNSDNGSDIDSVALGNTNLGEHSTDRRRNFGVDLVGGNLKQDLVFSNGVADCLEPLCDGSFSDGLTKLRKLNLCHGILRDLAVK